MQNLSEMLQRKQDFDTINKEIEKIYNSDLLPPSRELTLSIIIPSSAEIENDNFWRMLRSFLLQKKTTDHKKFELIFVINNPQLAVEAGLGRDLSGIDVNDIHQQTALKPDKLAKRYFENQKQLHIISLIQAAQEMAAGGANNDDVWKEVLKHLDNAGLTEYEVDLMRQAIEKKLCIQAIDASSDQRALSARKAENPVALSRNIGGHLAYNRLKQTAGDTGLIDFLDADCFVGPNYVNGLLSKVGQQDYCIKPMHSVITEIPKSVEKTDKMQQFLILAKFIRGHYFDYPYSYPAMSFDSLDTLGGPQVSLSTECFRKVDGYPQPRRDADYAFSQILRAKGSNSLVSESLVFVADREREGSVDGAARTNQNTTELKELLEMRTWKGKLETALNRNKRLSEHPNFGAAYKAFREKRFRQEMLARKFFQRNAEKTIAFLYKKYLKSPKASINEYTQDFFNPAEKLLNKREIDYLQQNLCIIEAAIVLFQMIQKEPKTVSQLVGFDIKKSSLPEPRIAILALQKMIPEQFAPPPISEPDYDQYLLDAQTNGTEVLAEANARDFAHINLAINDLVSQFKDARRVALTN